MRGLLLFALLAVLLIGCIIVSAVNETQVTVTQEVRANVVTEIISIFSPENRFYSENKVPINISVIPEAEYLKYSDNDGRFKTLCKNCDEYGYSKLKKKQFKDGFHQITILGRFNGEDVYAYVNFSIDSVAPKITRTAPTGRLSNNLFSVEFQEENPVSLFFNYGNTQTGFRNLQIDLNNCYGIQGNKKRCDVNINLTDYDSQTINYWFNLTDVLGRYDNSKARKLIVDVSAPVVNSFDYSVNRRRVNFVFNISEPNFDKISYTELNNKPVILCSNLVKGMCKKNESFKRGEHNLIIRISDKAGNEIEIKDISFKI